MTVENVLDNESEHCSMIAEIGGYAGLMIGFSILDFVVACQIAASIGSLRRRRRKK